MSRHKIIDGPLTWNKIPHLSLESIFSPRYKSVIEDESSCQWTAINNANNCRERVFRGKKRSCRQRREHDREKERRERKKKVKRGIEEESLQVKARGRLAANNDTTNTRVLIVLLARDTVSAPILPRLRKSGPHPAKVRVLILKTCPQQ